MQIQPDATAVLQHYITELANAHQRLASAHGTIASLTAAYNAKAADLATMKKAASGAPAAEEGTS